MAVKTSVLVLNVGTPDSPSPNKVRTYLKEFLSDPRVIDIPALGRWLLLNLFILPFRPKKSAHAYAKVWTAAGSPLLEYTRAFTEKLRDQLPTTHRVEFAMRYGSPSIPSTLQKLLADAPDELILLPMYPQYSSAATGSALEKVFSLVGKAWNVPAVQVIGPFFKNPGFLDAIVATGKPLIQSMAPDHILFSYHGLPERQIQKSQNVEGHCLKPNDTCCAVLSDQNSYCYRAQCFETTRQLVNRLGLEPGSYTTCFQSRLGRTPWIKPYTDIQIQALAKQGKKRILVFSPSFVADCLETLEEISIRGLASFVEAGGEQLVLVPSLNSSDAWVKTAAQLVLNSSRGKASLP